MPTTLIANATIVTGDPARNVIDDGAIAITDGVVAAVGSTTDLLASYQGADVVDGRGKAVFPGLINCHAHLLNVLSRGITEDFGFPPDLPFPISIYSLVSDEDKKALATLGAVEAIRSGSTTLLEMAAGIDLYADSIVDTGMRLILAENTDDGVVGPAYRPGQPPSVFSEEQRATKLGRASTCSRNGTAHATDASPVLVRHSSSRQVRLNCSKKCAHWRSDTTPATQSTSPRAVSKSRPCLRCEASDRPTISPITIF